MPRHGLHRSATRLRLRSYVCGPLVVQVIGPSSLGLGSRLGLGSGYT